jgi:hypothetical protein
MLMAFASDRIMLREMIVRSIISGPTELLRLADDA